MSEAALKFWNTIVKELMAVSSFLESHQKLVKLAMALVPIDNEDLAKLLIAAIQPPVAPVVEPTAPTEQPKPAEPAQQAGVQTLS